MANNDDKITLSAVNKITGEIFETQVNPYDPDSLADTLLDIVAMKKELETLEKDVKAIAKDYMEANDFKPVPLKNGMQWTYRSDMMTTYDFATVSRFIDQDLMITYKDKKGSPLVKLGVTPLKELVKDLVAEGAIEDGAWKQIEDSAEHKAKAPYVKLEKA